VHRRQSSLLLPSGDSPLCSVGKSDHIQVHDILWLTAKIQYSIKTIFCQIIDVDLPSIVFADGEILALLADAKVEVLIVGFLLIKEFGLIELLVVEVQYSRLDVL
jgi:hypothetical protein